MTIEASDKLPPEKTFLQGGTSEFLELKQLLETRLPPKIAAYGQGSPDVGMTIKVISVTLQVNDAKVLLVADAQHVYTTVTLWDLHTHTVIATANVVAMTHTRGGVLGIAQESFDNAKDVQDSKIKLTDMYIDNLITKLYPAK